MSRFNQTKNVGAVKGSGDLTVLHPGNLAFDPKKFEAAKGALERAVKWLKSAESQTSGRLSRKAKKYAQLYFLCDKGGPSTGELELIRSVIIKSLNGLGSDTTLKIGPNISKKDLGPGLIVVGQVKSKREAGPLNQSGRPCTKPYHNEINHSKYGMVRQGAITMDMNAITTHTLIHESTHKFAATVDYCYLSEDGSPRTGQSFTEKDKALNNADSYAHFVAAVGRGFFG